MSLALIDYGAGNLQSVRNALKAAGAGEVAVTADPDMVRRADRIVLPGVGAFAHCMTALRSIDGMVDALNERVRAQGTPFLGICVGMQLMAELGREHEATAGLGWIGGEVRAITPSDPSLKIPHMGWNTLMPTMPHPLFKNIALGEKGLHAYFVHSYAMHCTDARHCLATTDHGGPITAAIGRDNLAGTQFHPEKSQALGLQLIGNFLEWRP